MNRVGSRKDHLAPNGDDKKNVKETCFARVFIVHFRLWSLVAHMYNVSHGPDTSY